MTETKDDNGFESIAARLVETVRIPLAREKGFALVNKDVAEEVGKYAWCLHRTRWASYAHQGKLGRAPQLHRFVMELYLGRKLLSIEQIDHINHDGLDNRRENLRLATPSQNLANQRVRRGAASTYKGVTWETSSHKWYASIVVRQKHINLGRFDDEEAAARAYDRAAREHFGEFACTNFGEVI
jgi:hypothetical protein